MVMNACVQRRSHGDTQKAIKWCGQRQEAAALHACRFASADRALAHETVASFRRFTAMIAEGLQPDEITYGTIINAFAQGAPTARATSGRTLMPRSPESNR